MLTLAGLGDALFLLTSSSSNSIGTGSKTFATQANKDIGVGSFVLAYSAGGPANYLFGQVTAYSGAVLTVNATLSGGSGTYTDWTIRAAGAGGATGAVGPGYAATSATGNTIANTGSKSFAVGTGLAYSVGARVRATESAGSTAWMEGVVTGYTGGNLTFTADKKSGAGTFSAWTINVTGEPGAGDLLSSNNLSDLASPKTGFDNISVHGADVASAASIDLEAAGGVLVDVTGATTITAITLSNGRERVVRFTGALTLTNGASLVLPGAANIVTAAGDFAIFRGYAAGVVRCVHYLRAAGRPLNSGVSDNLTAGFTATSFNAGTKSSGTFTPDPTQGNIQHYTNGGAHTLSPPSSPCTMVIECTNSSAGALTTSGFSIVDGDTYSNTGTKKHVFYITKTSSFSHLNVRYVIGT